MGLDNGFLIDRKTASYEALKAFDDEWRRKMGYDLEIAYWRKCWNVRAIILDVICVSENDCGVYTLTIEDVKQIYTKLQKFKQKNFLDCGDCIWEWPTFLRAHRRNLKRIRKLITLMKKCPTMEVLFYDSW